MAAYDTQKSWRMSSAAIDERLLVCKQASFVRMNSLLNAYQLFTQIEIEAFVIFLARSREAVLRSCALLLSWLSFFRQRQLSALQYRYANPEHVRLHSPHHVLRLQW